MSDLFISALSSGIGDADQIGWARRVEDSSFRLHALAWAFDAGEVEVCDLRDGPAPRVLLSALEGTGTKIWAHDGACLQAELTAGLGIAMRSGRILCLGGRAATLGLPRRMDTLLAALDPPELSEAITPRSGRTYSERLSGNDLGRDVDRAHSLANLVANTHALRWCVEKLSVFVLPDWEQELCALDHRINLRGIPIDIDAMKAAMAHVEELARRRGEALTKLTGMTKPTPQELLQWLRRVGYRHNDLSKHHINAALVAARTPRLQQALRLRQDISRTALDKFGAVDRAVSKDGRLRGMLRFSGASRTRRWSGQILQPHNLPLPPKALVTLASDIVDKLPQLDFDDLEALPGGAADALTAAIRPIIAAPPGKLLADADWNAIENRVLGWLAEDAAVLDVYRSGRDPYVCFAALLFGEDYAAIASRVAEGDKTQRNLAKPAVLGCGFGLGPGSETGPDGEPTGLLAYAAGMGIVMTLSEAQLAVRTFRASYPRVVELWQRLEKAALHTLRSGQVSRVGRLRFDRPTDRVLRLVLPSKGYISYWDPQISSDVRGDQVTYMHVDRGSWRRVPTHGAKLAENAVQAVARDILAHGLLGADKAGLDLVLHVHDQIVVEVAEADADAALETLLSCMSACPPWADDELPLRAEGHLSRRFCKV